MEQITAPVKMNANDTIVRLLKCINDGQRDDFYKIVEAYKDSLAQSSNTRHQITSWLRQKPMQFKSLGELSGSVKKLLIQETLKDENVYLPGNMSGLFAELKREYENQEVFRYHNLPVRNKIFLYGPTGNGKTTIAKEIARIFNLPFVEANVDLFRDSHIGTTSHNLTNCFKEIQQPCVFFFDEFDTLSRKRGNDNNAAGAENDNIVNSLLVNIERLNQNVILVAATNHIEKIDSAVLRRFHEKVEVGIPSVQEKLKFSIQICEYYHLPSEYLLPVEREIDKYENFSAIKDYFTAAARKLVMQRIHD